MTYRIHLEPCPFCGSHDVELITGKGKFDRVHCNYCGTTGPWSDEHPEDAVAEWNHRELISNCKKRGSRICTGCGAQLPECICPPPPENNPGPQSCDGWS